MLLDITDVKTQENFLLLLEFENGEKKEFDCKPLFEKKPFQVLKDEQFFKNAKLGYGTVVWSDEIDISPETLYIDSKDIN